MSLVEDVLTFLTQRMHIEAEWAVQEESSFRWWPSSLPQRVTVAPPRELQGVELRTVHIETDLLSGMTIDDTTWSRLAGVNRLASLSAYVADTTAGTLKLHASVSLTEDNWLLARGVALHAMALQLSDAHGESLALAEAFGAQVAHSPHPRSGPRTTPDEMIGIIESYQQRGDGASPFTPEELAQLVHLDPRPWMVAANDLHCINADLEFATGLPSRLQLDAAERHPSLGSGLQMRLLLPIEPDAAVAQKLNANECIEPDSHQLGAWCVDEERGLMFTGFIPAAAYMPGLSRALVYHLAARNEWARALLFPSA